jgi:hypothetical protein
MWPFKRHPDLANIDERLLRLEAQMGVFQVDYQDAVGKLSKIAMRVEERYRVADTRSKAEEEKAELKEILGSVNIAEILKNPEALKMALNNPALIEYGLKKLTKEMI